MTSLVIISDTHDRVLPDLVTSHIENADVILHVGDFTGMEYYEMLESYGKPVYGVLGNMDRGLLESKLPLKRLLKIEEVSIAMIHGWGAPGGLEERVTGAFERMDWDVLVFGHSHSPVLKKEGRKFLLNPGSPTDKRFARTNSFIAMTIDQGDVNAEIISL